VLAPLAADSCGGQLAAAAKALIAEQSQADACMAPEHLCYHHVRTVTAITSTGLWDVHERGVQVLVLDSVQAVTGACNARIRLLWFPECWWATSQGDHTHEHEGNPDAGGLK
jgi:hypothetical protein